MPAETIVENVVTTGRVKLCPYGSNTFWTAIMDIAVKNVLSNVPKRAKTIIDLRHLKNCWFGTKYPASNTIGGNSTQKKRLGSSRNS